jgi:hypothetical protein
MWTLCVLAMKRPGVILILQVIKAHYRKRYKSNHVQESRSAAQKKYKRVPIGLVSSIYSVPNQYSRNIWVQRTSYLSGSPRFLRYPLVKIKSSALIPAWCSSVTANVLLRRFRFLGSQQSSIGGHRTGAHHRPAPVPAWCSLSPLMYHHTDETEGGDPWSWAWSMHGTGGSRPGAHDQAMPMSYGPQRHQRIGVCMGSKRTT